MSRLFFDSTGSGLLGSTLLRLQQSSSLHQAGLCQREVGLQAFLLIRTEAGFKGQASAWKGLCPPSKMRLPIG
jgi:hypothetical protein